jgi:hypothetical protein
MSQSLTKLLMAVVTEALRAFGLAEKGVAAGGRMLRQALLNVMNGNKMPVSLRTTVVSA